MHPRCVVSFPGKGEEDLLSLCSLVTGPRLTGFESNQSVQNSSERRLTVHSDRNQGRLGRVCPNFVLCYATPGPSRPSRQIFKRRDDYGDLTYEGPDSRQRYWTDVRVGLFG